MKFFLRLIYLFERKRLREHEQEGQREMERESQADSALSVEPDPRILRS